MGSSPGFRLFLSASGSLGGVMTATRWKGCQYWIPKTGPGKQKSTKQIEIRKRFTTADRAWKKSFNTEYVRYTWDLAAGDGYKPQSGYNAYMSAAYHALVTDPGVMMVSSVEVVGDRLQLNVSQVDPTATRSDHEDVVIWMGYSPRNMQPWATGNLYYNWLQTPPLPGLGIYYIRMAYNGLPVSGLIRFQNK